MKSKVLCHNTLYCVIFTIYVASYITNITAWHCCFVYLQKHNKTNYVELAPFNSKQPVVMPVGVPTVDYTNVTIQKYVHNIMTIDIRTL